MKIGLFPGAGGTQRVARMLPPGDALQFLLKGDQLRLSRAKGMKLIDAVVPAADLINTAKQWIKAGGSAKAPWDTEGFRLPGGLVYSKAGMMTFPAANAIYRRETYDNYPAARAIMQVVYEGLQLPMDLALRVEWRWFAKILRSPEAAHDDPLAVRLDAGAQQGRAPARGRPGDQAQEDRRHRRGLHGRRHRLRDRAGGYRGRADRPRPGRGRQGQGSFGQADERSGQSRPRQRRRPRGAAGAHRADGGLRRVEGLRSGHRGSVRRPSGEGRGHRQGRSRDRRQDRVRFQHLDAADHIAGTGLEASRRSSSACISSRRSSA